MDVLILHNPRAGNKRVTKTRLIRAFQRGGHRVRYRSIHDHGWKRVLAKSWDLVVAAGGDGAVAKIALALAKRHGTTVPLTIVPAGVANNIARALDLSRHGRIAVGVLESPWGTMRFLESVGIGPMAELMVTKTSLRGGLARLRRAFASAEPRALRVRADGRKFDGEYLMVQVLNIGAIGPRLALARAADPGDDRLELLLVKPEQRQQFESFLTARAAGKAQRCPVRAIRARRIEILGWPARDGGQVDDKAWPEARRPKFGKVRVRVEGRVTVLPPKARADG